MYLRMSGAMATRQTRLSSEARLSMSVAAKSIWPDSGCPPISAPYRAARSTFTRSPCAFPPSVVTFRLGRTRSNMADVGVGRALTVRHTPSTDTLAPRPRSWQKPAGNSRVRRRRSVLSWMAAMRAMAWTMPLNMVLARFPPRAAGVAAGLAPIVPLAAGRLCAGLSYFACLSCLTCHAAWHIWWRWRWRWQWRWRWRGGGWWWGGWGGGGRGGGGVGGGGVFFWGGGCCGGGGGGGWWRWRAAMAIGGKKCCAPPAPMALCLGLEIMKRNGAPSPRPPPSDRPSPPR